MAKQSLTTRWSVRGAVIATAAVMVFAAEAVAQQPAPPPAGAAATAPTGPVLQLTMDQAVSMALEASLGLKGERLGVDIAAQNILSARAAFLPQLSSGFTRGSSKSVPFDFTQGTNDITSESLGFSGAVSQQLPWFGARYRANWNGSRGTTVGGVAPTFNPSLGSSVSFNITQPLWQRLRIDSTRAGLERSERQHTIADLSLQQQIVSTEAGARSAYLGLIAAIEGRNVAQQNMDLAEQSLRNSRARVQVGQAPQIDIITAEAQVESNRDQLIASEANIAQAEDGLRLVILDPARPDYWDIHLQPADRIELTQRTVDLNAAIQNALANRLDLIVLKRNIEISDLNMRLSRDAVHPSIDLSFDYSARGSGGTKFSYATEGFPPAVLSTTEKGFGSVVGGMFAYPGWTIGVNVGYPVGRTAAETAVATAQLGQQQEQMQLRQLELDIIRDVRQATRNVQTSYQRVQATQAGLSATERQLNAEERRFAVGLTDLFTLQQRQRDLASARVSQLNAVISYNRALIEFDRVQKTR